MTFKILLTAKATADLEGVHEKLSAYSTAVADRTVELIKQSILELSRLPRRYVLAPESERSTIELRHLIVGKYRIIDTIHDDVVRVYTIAHTSQQTLNPADFL